MSEELIDRIERLEALLRKARKRLDSTAYPKLCAEIDRELSVLSKKEA